MPETNTSLYRAVPEGTMDGPFVVDDKPVEGLLYPRFYTTTYEDADGKERTSQADLTTYTDDKSGAEMVKDDGGTSMHDAEGWFGNDTWRYFHIPEKTKYPDSLNIKRGKKKKKNRTGTVSGRHYQIEPKHPMTVLSYKGALDNFARNAVVQQVALAK